MWKFINKTEKKRKWIENNIVKEKWQKYFKNLLGGKEEDKNLNEGGSIGNINKIEDDNQGEVEEIEIREVIRKIKMKKESGVDRIPMEAWRYGGEAVKRDLIEIIKKCWKEEKIPENWSKSTIVPLYKRGDKENIKNYRGISLLCAAHKIYAEIIRWKREIEMEGKGLIPKN